MGNGNLSPLDDPFELRALVSLTPTKQSKLAFVGRHMGRRLNRYSKETDLWIDVFEGEPELSRQLKETDAKLTYKPWEKSPGLLGEGKFTDIVACQTSQLEASLGDVCGQIAKSLKAGGRLFHADLALDAAPTAGPQVLQHLKPLTEHKAALASSGLKLSQEIDLTKEIIATIRSGFQACTSALAALRTLDEPHRRLMTLSFGAQLETWASIALLMETGKITAHVLLAGMP